MEKFIWEWNSINEWLPLKDAFICSHFAQKGSSVLEIGVHKGGWLFALAQNTRNLIGVGIDPYPDNEPVKAYFLEQIRERKLEESIFLYSDWKALSTGQHGEFQFDIIHIDGEHSEKAVVEDLKKAKPFLAKKGILVIDDIFYHSFPGVTSAAFEFIQQEKLSPFLLTQKKLYLCHPDFYEEFYIKTYDLLLENRITFEEDLKLNENSPKWAQSNAIFGKSLLITDGDGSKEKNFLKQINVKQKPINTKEIIRMFCPPVVLDAIKKLL